MRTSALFGAKNIGFFWNLWCVCKDKWGWASADIFWTREGEVNFLQFCVDALMEGPNT